MVPAVRVDPLRRICCPTTFNPSEPVLYLKTCPPVSSSRSGHQPDRSPSNHWLIYFSLLYPLPTTTITIITITTIKTFPAHCLTKLTYLPMLKAPDSNFKKLAAIDPVAARQYAKIKSASIEANNDNDQPNSPTSREHDFDEISLPNTDYGDQTEDSQSGNNSASSKASRSFLTPSPGVLKPSVSTSCLLTSAEDSSKSTSNLICFPTRASLTHEWKKLMTPNKCRECNFLVYFNGRECSFCGFVAHKKCVTSLVIKCSGQRAGSVKNKKQAQSRNQTKKGKSPSVQPLFGQPLDMIDCNQIVDFMRRFVYEIDTRGLALKGIYRVSSIKSKVDKLCNYYDQHLSCLVDLSAFHPNVIANALKNYLRQLPEPLLTNKLYNEFINIAKKYPKQSSPNQLSTTMNANNSLFNNQQQPAALTPKPWKPYSSLLSTPQANLANNPNYNPMLIVELKDIVDLLPQINRDVIAIIMRHLKRVANMSEENQMSATNLSIIFGPTLLSSSENNTLAIVDNVHQARVVELMIIWANQIFPQYENYESKVDIDIHVQEYD